MKDDIKALRDDPVDILALYGGKDGARDWITAGCWVRPGDALAHISADLPERIARLLDALEVAQADAARYKQVLEDSLAMMRDDLEAAQKDAARYRWLLQVAEGAASDGDHCPIIKLYGLLGAAEDAFLLEAPHLTDAIDAAMKGTE